MVSSLKESCRNPVRMSDFAHLKKFSDRLGPVYGTEDFAIFLYSLIKMQKPSVVLELGTGAGVAALWMAMALKENGSGQLWTLDNGSHWDTIKTNENYPFSVAERAQSYPEYVAQKCQEFGVEAQLKLLSQSAPPLPDPGKKIDLLFADFEHDPGAIIRLLSFYLPRLSDCASVFVDSATTYFPSYAYLENLIPILNRGQIRARGYL